MIKNINFKLLIRSCFFLLIFYNLVIIWLFAWNGENEYCLVAQGIMNGFLPYQFSGSHKSPGTGMLLAPLFMIFSYNLFVARIAIFCLNSLTLWILWKTMGIFGFTETRKWFSACLYLISLALFGGTDLRAEQFIALFGLLSFYLYVKKDMFAEGKHIINFFVTGFFIFLCFLFKQTGLLYLVGYTGFFILVFLFKELRLKETLKRMFGTATGVLSLIALFFLFYRLHGLAGLVWDNVFPQVVAAYPRDFSWKTAFDFFIGQIPLLWILMLFGALKVVKDAVSKSKINSPEVLLFVLAISGLLIHFQKLWHYYTLQTLPLMIILAGIGMKYIAESPFFGRFKKTAFVLTVLLLAPAAARVGLNTARFFYYLIRVHPAGVEFQKQKTPLSVYTIWHDLALADEIRSHTVEKEIVAMYSEHRYYFFAGIFPHGRNVIPPATDFETDIAKSVTDKKIRTVIILEWENFNEASPLGQVIKKGFNRKMTLRNSPTQVVLFQRDVPPVTFTKVRWDKQRYEWYPEK